MSPQEGEKHYRDHEPNGTEVFSSLYEEKEGPEAQGFTVRAEGAEIVHRWLKVQESMARDPISSSVATNHGNGSIGLELGAFVIGDSLLDGLGAGVLYDQKNFTYQISSQAIFQVDQDRGRSGSGLLDLIENVDQGRKGGSSFLDIMKAVSSRPKQPISLPEMASALRQTIGKTSNFSLTYKAGKTEKDQITIKSTDGFVKDTEEEFVLHPLPQDPFTPPGYCLHIEGHLEGKEGSLEVISRKYTKLAELTQHVLNSMYLLKDGSAPTKTLIMSPKKNTSAILDSLELAVKAKKRMLSMNGLLDGNEDFAEEIKSKMIVEKRPQVSFDDIGGCDLAKEELQTVVDALRNPDLYKRWGTQAPRGVLLFGAPGTGKTLLAKALAHEAQAQIMIVNTADVLHSLYGKTERLLQAAFDEAKKNGSVVLLFDELDALAGTRDHSNEVTSRIVSVLLQNLDGLKDRGNNIIAVGTTNRLDAIDPALLRPGRFDRLIEVPLPEEEQRADIFRIHMHHAWERAGQRELFDPELTDLGELISKTKGFSGADIEEVIRRTLARKVRQETKGENPGLVTASDLAGVIEKYERIRQAKTLGFPIPSL